MMKLGIRMRNYECSAMGIFWAHLQHQFSVVTSKRQSMMRLPRHGGIHKVPDTQVVPSNFGSSFAPSSDVHIVEHCFGGNG